MLLWKRSQKRLLLRGTITTLEPSRCRGVQSGNSGSSSRKATFGFNVRYKTGASTVPGGHLEFHYQTGNFHLQSFEIDWLVLTNSNWAHLQGLATLDHDSDLYSFRVDARDGTIDRFVIKIWGAGRTPTRTTRGTEDQGILEVETSGSAANGNPISPEYRSPGMGDIAPWRQPRISALPRAVRIGQLPARPKNTTTARPSLTMSWSARRPIRSPSLDRGTVMTLSTIRLLDSRNPL